MRRANTFLLRVCILAVLSLPLAAQAASIAARAGVSTISPCPSFCGGSGRVSEFDSEGGEGVTSASASIQTGVNGNGRASAQLNGGGISLPTLRAEAFSNPNARVSAGASAMQKYTYSGATSNFSLDITLDGTVVDGAQPPDADIRADIIVVTAPDLEFSSDYATMFFEVIDLTPGTDVLDVLNLSFQSLDLVDLGLQTVLSGVDFTLNNGDSVYVWAGLSASGTRGGSADAFNTLGMSFSSGNTAGLTAVPLPAPLVLFASSLGLLGWLRRRRAA